MPAALTQAANKLLLLRAAQETTSLKSDMVCAASSLVYPCLLSGLDQHSLRTTVRRLDWKIA
jgi:hypothetical protein